MFVEIDDRKSSSVDRGEHESKELSLRTPVCYTTTHINPIRLWYNPQPIPNPKPIPGIGSGAHAPANAGSCSPQPPGVVLYIRIPC